MRKIPMSRWVKWRAYAKMTGLFGPSDAQRQDYYHAVETMFAMSPMLADSDKRPENFLPPWTSKANYARWDVFDLSPETYVVAE